MSLWVPVLIACAGSYLIKLAGLSLPSSVLANPRVQRVRVGPAGPMTPPTLARR